MTSDVRHTRYGRRGGGWVDDDQREPGACDVCGQPVYAGGSTHVTCAAGREADGQEVLF